MASARTRPSLLSSSNPLPGYLARTLVNRSNSSSSSLRRAQQGSSGNSRQPPSRTPVQPSSVNQMLSSSSSSRILRALARVSSARTHFRTHSRRALARVGSVHSEVRVILFLQATPREPSHWTYSITTIQSARGTNNLFLRPTGTTLPTAAAAAIATAAINCVGLRFPLLLFASFGSSLFLDKSLFSASRSLIEMSFGVIELSPTQSIPGYAHVGPFRTPDHLPTNIYNGFQCLLLHSQTFPSIKPVQCVPENDAAVLTYLSLISSGSSTSPLFTRSTKFNDLPEELKKKFEDIEYVPFILTLYYLQFYLASLFHSLRRPYLLSRVSLILTHYIFLSSISMRIEQYLTSSLFLSTNQIHNSAHIQGRIQIGNELKQHRLGEEPQKGSEQIRAVCKVCLASSHMSFSRFILHSIRHRVFFHA